VHEQAAVKKEEVMDSETVLGILVSEGYSASVWGFSALDRYMGYASLPFTWVETDADTPALARFFEGFRFPGTDIADGAVDTGERSWYFHCLDPEEACGGTTIRWSAETRGPSYTLLSLHQAWQTKRFQDPHGVYPLLRELRDGPAPRSQRGEKTEEGLRKGAGFRFRGDTAGGLSAGAADDNRPEAPWWTGIYPGTGRYQAIMDGALILARYGTARTDSSPIAEMAAYIEPLPLGPPPNAESQRILLSSLLVSPRPDLGLEFLKAGGFLEEWWPELNLLDDVDHSKEFHPEGNVWRHTMETFRYRKAAAHKRTAYDLRLSLGLLLHDVGKPLAASSGNRRFAGHAELGAAAARKFLERLEFDASVVEAIYYLVKNHMLPAALPRLPLTRTRKIIESDLFPTLMELYRCDESSSFKGLDAYYKTSAAYRGYLRKKTADTFF
jgi:poly(A) polymerase